MVSVVNTQVLTCVQHLSIHHYADMFVELSFKSHTSARQDDISLYEKVSENPTTGRSEKAQFEELEVGPK